MSENFHNRG